ncbi:glycosyltransferase family 2 protein [Propionicimonas sp.]|uniref:glycosyltransferase family 2 protein n=1 Tax=Propionicimonas sp. TaxID=1955623 RepID=UPI0039E566BA
MTGPAPVTVVICAYTLQRWTELELALTTVLAGPGSVHTVLVCDHNDELYAQARRAWPTVTVVPNRGSRGLSGARNTALELVTTELVVFLDDDACPADGWLDALLAPFADPEVVATGGVARPVWPDGRRPAHLPEELWWVVGCSFAGQPDSGRVRNVMGCNMAFRTDSLRAVGGFSGDLGRVGRHPVGGEETEACLRIGRREPSRRIAFVAPAVVRHHVTRERTSFAYLVRRSYGEGLSKAALARMVTGAEALSTEGHYVRRTVPRAVLRELRHPLRGGARAAGGLVTSVLAAGLGYLRGTVAGQVTPVAREPRAPLEVRTA